MESQKTKLRELIDAIEFCTACVGEGEICEMHNSEAGVYELSPCLACEGAGTRVAELENALLEEKQWRILYEETLHIVAEGTKVKSEPGQYARRGMSLLAMREIIYRTLGEDESDVIVFCDSCGVGLHRQLAAFDDEHVFCGNCLEESLLRHRKVTEILRKEADDYQRSFEASRAAEERDRESGKLQPHQGYWSTWNYYEGLWKAYKRSADLLEGDLK